MRSARARDKFLLRMASKLLLSISRHLPPTHCHSTAEVSIHASKQLRSLSTDTAYLLIVEPHILV